MNVTTTSVTKAIAQCVNIFVILLIQILYYNKDTSVIKEVDIDMSRLLTAESYWKEIVKEHSLGLPNLRPNVSPVMEWECRYCMYKTRCDNDNKGEVNE